MTLLNDFSEELSYNYIKHMFTTTTPHCNDKS